MRGIFDSETVTVKTLLSQQIFLDHPSSNSLNRSAQSIHAPPVTAADAAGKIMGWSPPHIFLFPVS